MELEFQAMTINNTIKELRDEKGKTDGCYFKSQVQSRLCFFKMGENKTYLYTELRVSYTGIVPEQGN